MNGLWSKSIHFIDWIGLRKRWEFSTSYFSCENFFYPTRFIGQIVSRFFSCKLLKNWEKYIFLYTESVREKFLFFKQATRALKSSTISIQSMDWNGSPNNHVFGQAIWSMNFSSISLHFLDWIGSRILWFFMQAFWALKIEIFQFVLYTVSVR